MLTYILKRILLMVPTLLGALTITFIVIQFVPGGPIDQIMAEARASQKGDGISYKASRDSDAKQIAELKKLYGFDKPAHVRYFEMLGNFLRFDLGRSFLHNKDVWQLIKEKLPVSISLGMWTFLFSYLISLPLGIAKAVREGTRFDVITSLVVLIGYAIPGFVLGIFLIVMFSGGTFLEWFPLRGLTSDNWADLTWPARITDYFWHLSLPLICMVIGSFAVVTMLTKNTFVEEMRKQYVLVAKAKGLSDRKVLFKHIFRNAMIPLVTGFPHAFMGAFFAGSVLIETLFSLDGLGLLSFESVVRRDYPVVLGSLYLFTLIGLVVKLISDLLYVMVDPRIQFNAVAK
ncbi:MAG: ABC transporter permease subunit [Betaproteobacteria bacterium]|jgi:microcin C transport system permease protein|nr:ABC transporter permease subunit [Burkholderiales bacterium]NBX13834.1 ABC transporter permease subunit [Betaproteobacteria bacterium]NBX89978.1 ABC transporter permease subunit [Betaproteobacteria bacterium]